MLKLSSSRRQLGACKLSSAVNAENGNLLELIENLHPHISVEDGGLELILLMDRLV